MPVTQEELNRFHEFASARLNNGGGDASLHELVELWLESGVARDVACEQRAAVNAVLRRSIRELESGLDRPAAEVMAEIREELDLPAT